MNVDQPFRYLKSAVKYNKIIEGKSGEVSKFAIDGKTNKIRSFFRKNAEGEVIKGDILDNGRFHIYETKDCYIEKEVTPVLDNRELVGYYVDTFKLNNDGSIIKDKYFRDLQGNVKKFGK